MNNKIIETVKLGGIKDMVENFIDGTVHVYDSIVHSTITDNNRENSSHVSKNQHGRLQREDLCRKSRVTCISRAC